MKINLIILILTSKGHGGYYHVCMYVCTCMRVCVRACVCVSVITFPATSLIFF